MITTPKSNRLHIGIFGRRNVGKSSLLNALTRQAVSIVSDVAGTTTDPVEKPMEMLPLGPVLFIDTAGVDDIGALGAQRVARARKIIDRADVGLIVTEPGSWGEFERALTDTFAERKTPVLAVINKCDRAEPDESLVKELNDRAIPWVRTAAPKGEGIIDIREQLIRLAPEDFVNAPPLCGDLAPPGELYILVAPIDLEAPRGRLILPQVQAIRDILDNDSYCMVVKERELADALNRLKRKPALVITDSQAVLKVAGDTPPEIPLTTFSILFARARGDLSTFAANAGAIDSLRSGDRVLIAEACSHHPIGEDIGRVKIPRWLTQYVGGKLVFEHVQGHDFPDNLADYKLVINCGGCMLNRRAMLSRILHCRRAGVPITNYGLVISYSLGVYERVLQPFPAALEAYKSGL